MIYPTDKIIINVVIRGVDQGSGNNFSDSIAQLMTVGIKEEVAIKFVMAQIVNLANMEDVISKDRLPESVKALNIQQIYSEIRNNIYRDDVISHLNIKGNNATASEVLDYFRILLAEDLRELESRLQKILNTNEYTKDEYTKDEKALLKISRLHLGNPSRWEDKYSEPKTFLEYYTEISDRYPIVSNEESKADNKFNLEESIGESARTILQISDNLGCYHHEYLKYFDAEIKKFYDQEFDYYDRQVIKSLLVRILLGNWAQKIALNEVPERYIDLVDLFNKVVEKAPNGLFQKYQEYSDKIADIIRQIPNPTQNSSENNQDFLRKIGYPLDLLPDDFITNHPDESNILILDSESLISDNCLEKLMSKKRYDFVDRILDLFSQEKKFAILRDRVRCNDYKGFELLLSKGVNIQNEELVFEDAIKSISADILSFVIKRNKLSEDFLAKKGSSFIESVINSKKGAKSKEVAELLLEIPAIANSELGREVIKKREVYNSVNKESLKEMTRRLAEINQHLLVAKSGASISMHGLDDSAKELEDQISSVKNNLSGYESLFTKPELGKEIYQQRVQPQARRQTSNSVRSPEVVQVSQEVACGCIIS